MGLHPLRRPPGPLLARGLPGAALRPGPRPGRPPLLARLLSGEEENAAGADPLARDGRLAQVEAALLAADEPLSPRRLAAAAGLTGGAAEIRQLLERLRRLYDEDGTAFQVEELGGGYQLLTRPDYHPWLVRLRSGGSEMKLSAAARETLTIVAYRQPIARADIDSIRGVQSGEILRQLMEKGLLRIAGRDTSLGRPVLYGTTKKFLQLFGLRSLRDLPSVPDLSKPRGS